MNMKNYLAAAIVIALPIAQTAQADFMGTVDGHGTGQSDQTDLSVEVNANAFGQEFQWAGLRVNYKVNESLVVFADASKLDATDVPLTETVTAAYEGQAFGAGFVYQMNDVLAGYKTSVKGAYHTAKLPDVSDLEFAGARVDTDLELTSLDAKFLLTPNEPFMDNGLSWYAALGYSKIETMISGPENIEFEDLAGFSAGAGIVMPLSFGDAYVGIESIDGERLAGGGIRFAF